MPVPALVAVTAQTVPVSVPFPVFVGASTVSSFVCACLAFDPSFVGIWGAMSSFVSAF